MIELTANLNENSSFREYVARQSRTTSNGDYNLHEKVMQLTTFVHNNAPINQTVACPFMAIQHSANYEEYRLEDTSRSDASFVFLAELSSLKEATETHISSWHGFTRLLDGTLRHPETQLGNEVLVSPGSSWMPIQVIQERVEQETIYTDTNRVLSFGEALYALDRISRPIEEEDIPLSVDPDDYPVV